MEKLKIFIANHGKYNQDPIISYENNLVDIKEAMEIMTDEWICNDNTCFETIIHMRDAIKQLINQADVT